MSGYSELGGDHHEILGQGRRFLQKPYSLQNLTRAIREALETNPSPALTSQ